MYVEHSIFWSTRIPKIGLNPIELKISQKLYIWPIKNLTQFLKTMLFNFMIQKG